MQKHFVPNNTKECIIPHGYENINIVMEGCIRNAAKGHWQIRIAIDFLYSGYYINYNVIESLDNYMTRLQKLFDQKINKYNPNLNIHIYYGQIGKNNEFGYYITGNFEE